MKKFLFYLTSIVIATATISCSFFNSKMFQTELVDIEGKTLIKYGPKMNFEAITDSAVSYYSQEDYMVILGAEIKKGETVYKNDKFMLKALLRERFKTTGNSFQFVLRSYTYDMRILDDIIIGSTMDSVPFSGYIKEDLSFTREFENGKKQTGYLNENGRFIFE